MWLALRHAWQNHWDKHMATDSINLGAGSTRCFLSGSSGHREPVRVFPPHWMREGTSLFTPPSNVFFLSVVLYGGPSHLPPPQLREGVRTCHISEYRLQARSPSDSEKSIDAVQNMPQKLCPVAESRSRAVINCSTMKDDPKFRTLRTSSFSVVQRPH